MPASSGLEAELQALSLGLDLVGEHGKPTWIEMDTMEVVSMIQANKHVPANQQSSSRDEAPPKEINKVRP